MELAYKRIDKKYCKILIVLSCLFVLIPTAVVFASALTQPLIGMIGVDDSQLTIGMVGINNSDRLIDFSKSDWHINPSEYPIMLSIPLIFFLVASLFIIQFALSEDKSIKKLVIAAILITIALALLSGVQFNVNMLLGG